MTVIKDQTMQCVLELELVITAFIIMVKKKLLLILLNHEIYANKMEALIRERKFSLGIFSDSDSNL